MDTDERITGLERRVAALEQRLAAPDRAVASVVPASPPPPPPAPVGGPSSAAARPSTGGSRLVPPPAAAEQRSTGSVPVPAAAPETPARPASGPVAALASSETMLKWGGVLLVILAAGFAVSTAIQRGWVGPELQLLGAAALAAALVGAGWRLRHRRPAWVHPLCVAGVGTSLLTVASPLFRDQTSDLVSVCAISAIAAAALVLAHLVRSPWVAGAVHLGAVLSWVMIDQPRSWGTERTLGMLALGAALLLVAVGVLATVHKWWGLRSVLPALTTLVVVSAAVLVFADYYKELQGLSLVAIAVTSVFLLVVPNIGPPDGLARRFEMVVGLVAPMWCAYAVLVAVAVDRPSISGRSAAIAIAVAVAWAVAALVRPVVRFDLHRSSLLAGASGVISLFLPALLPAGWGLPAVVLQAVGVLFLAQMIGDERWLPWAARATVAVVGLVLLNELCAAWSENLRWDHDIANLLTVAALLGFVAIDRMAEVRRWAQLAALVLFMAWVGSVLVHVPQGQALVSAVWAALGVAVLVFGAVLRDAGAARVGLAVLGVTVAKLLSVDLSEVDTLWRALLFLAVGLGLMRLGFVLPRWTGELAGAAPPAPQPPPPTAPVATLPPPAAAPSMPQPLPPTSGPVEF